MTYTVTELVTGAFYTSGVVSREFQTVQGSQLNDGVQFLNDLLGEKTTENDMIPYYTDYLWTSIPNQEMYFIPNLIEIETLVFYLNNVRYQMTEVPMRQYFGTSRANTIYSLPLTYHMQRVPGGANIYLYFLPNTGYQMELWGLFRMNEVAYNQDLSSQSATANLGNIILTGTGGVGTLAPGQLLLNNIDLMGTYANQTAFINYINANVPGVIATASITNITLISSQNILFTTSGIGNPTNTITFTNFSTLNGPFSQTFISMFLDKFYISYLKYALAERICNEYDYAVPAGVALQLKKFMMQISKRSQQLDLRNKNISTLGQMTSLNYGVVNLSNGWSI